MPAIETESLTKFYGPHRGVQDVTIAVEQGEVFGFLGPNGAGKTTTIRTLLDLLHPTSGSARIFGLDSRRDSVAIRRRLGNLPGDFGYGKLATGRQALALGAKLRGISGLGDATALAERFQADLDRPLGQLSRGNRQKIGMYVIDLVGRLDPSLDGIRYASVFRYYGRAIENGIDPLSFLGVTVVAVAFAATGATLFERRDLFS